MTCIINRIINRKSRKLKTFCLFILLQFCGNGEKIIIIAPLEMKFLQHFVEDTRVEIQLCENPMNCSRESKTILIEKMECSECYEFEISGDKIILKGGYPLGIIYGLTHFLEINGYSFPHPFFTRFPDSINMEKAIEKLIPLQGKKFEPEIPVRGLHLHTLHPIEGLFSFWIPSEKGLNEAKAIIRWLVRQKGNYIQWVALNDIKRNERLYEEWKKHTEMIIQYARELGVRTGINTLLFSNSSLQNAYLILSPIDAQMILAPPFDHINFSFGEFVGDDPNTFINKVNSTAKMVKEIKPNIEISATIHVGNFENLWVNYNGESILYYFLVKYVDKSIIPLVHTVMYYNLFDDAGGAYNHSDFSLHREFLFEMMREERQVGYFPETAYWIAFDNSVPLYLPIYILSRWKDLKGIREKGTIHSHLIFSSGWEWGYWLNDYTSLRFSYNLPTTWTEFVYGLFGNTGGDIIKKLGEIEYTYLIEKRLAPYLSGEDFYIDLGCSSRVFFSQPCRISFPEILTMNESGKEKFSQNVLNPLSEMQSLLNELMKTVRDGNDPLMRELRHGLEITTLRVEFIKLLYSAVISYSRGSDFMEPLKKAEKLLESAEKVVLERYNEFFYPTPSLLVDSVSNPTIYQFGYLKQAHTLCLWNRDIKKVKILLLGEDPDSLPTCIH